MTDESIPKTERTWAMAAHLSTLCGLIGIPFGNIIAPLVIWLIKKEEMPFVDDQAKEALNFQISVSIYAIVASPTILIFGIGFLLLGAIGVFWLICVIIAAIKANDGEQYRYPLCIRFL